jgi:lysozyme
VRHINEKGLGIIKNYEKCKLKAYRCPAGVWTCGWGSTGPDIDTNTVWTQETADRRLFEHLELTEQCVERHVEVDISDNAFSALVSLVYNIGCTAFGKSTLLRKLNAGDMTGAENEFHRWNKSNGAVLNGLTTRRAAEAQLFSANETV